MLSVTQDSQEAPELCCHFLKAHCLFNYLKFKHFTVSSYTVCCEKLSKKELQGKKRRKKKTLSDTKSICVVYYFWTSTMVIIFWKWLMCFYFCLWARHFNCIWLEAANDFFFFTEEMQREKMRYHPASDMQNKIMLQEVSLHASSHFERLWAPRQQLLVLLTAAPPMHRTW